MSSSYIPSGWMTASIDEVATSSGGSTPSKSDPSYWINGGIPWVSPKDMKVFHIRSTEDLVTEKALTRLTKIPENSILMVVRSGILVRTLPIAINTVPVTINQDMRAFVPEKTVDPRFIAWQLIADEREILSDCSKDGTTVASIEGPALSAYPLKIAPALEQTRIVEKLEELLSDIDAGVAELKTAQRKLAQYRESLLKAAVEGALTADWRVAHGKPQKTGAEILHRFLSERRARWEQKQLAKFAQQGKTPSQGWEAKYAEPTAPDPRGLPSPPEGWVWTSLAHVADWSSGGTPSRAVSSYYSGSIPWFKTGELGPRILFDSEEHISEEALSNSSAKIFPSGSVALAMYGATIGKTSILGVDGATNQACAVGIPDAVTSDFLYLFLLSQEGDFREAGKGGAQPNISQGIVKGWPIRLPPRAEQDQIVSLASGLLESMAELERAIDRALQQVKAQRSNLLKAAFAGQLVPQDPRDEPASVLLERIRAERSESAKQPKARRTKHQREIAAVVNRLIDVLADAGDWMPAQEAFRRCGVADGALTDQIEHLYAELRALDKAGRLAVEPVVDGQGRKLYDKLKLVAG